MDEYAPLETGGRFPRDEDIQRLERYETAEKLWSGVHHAHPVARRITQKLRELNALAGGMDAEGVVYLVLNNPRLICEKFADLQVLQTPQFTGDTGDDARSLFAEAMPDLWARWHYELAYKRCLGDGLVTIFRKPQTGAVQIRPASPSRWFPVLDGADQQTVLAHQLAWVEDHEDGKRINRYLRVDMAEPDQITRRAFLLDGDDVEKKPIQQYDIKGEVDLGLHWPGLRSAEAAALGGYMPIVHLPHGRIDPHLPFGRPEFIDSGGLIDDVNWRLSTWSDVNDRVSHPAEIIPTSYLVQDDDGTVEPPSQYTRTFRQTSSGRGDPGDVPAYRQLDVDHDTLKENFEQSFLALCMRHGMAPALLGWQFGNEKESGEAKSLGMGTTEATTRRDLLYTAPLVDRALTIAGRMAGLSQDAEITTHWRVGLPKTQDELFEEVNRELLAKLTTKRRALKRLNPQLTEDQVDELLAEIVAEEDETRRKESSFMGAEIQ